MLRLLLFVVPCLVAACSQLETDDDLDDDADAAAPTPVLPASHPPAARHTICGNPVPAVPPSLPHVDFDPKGRPLFDQWRDTPCGDLRLCDEGGAPDCGYCFRGTPDAEKGLCSGMWADDDTGCDSIRPAMGYLDRRCWFCVATEAHARACCSGFPGFDCRAWPFPGDGLPGTICARHEDCEAGLICGPGGRWATGYGVCQCPGIEVALPGICRLTQ